MQYQHIADFDASPYLSTTMFTLAEGVTLAKNLIARTPEDPPPGIREAVAALTEVADEAEAAMVERIRRDSASDEAMAIDHAVDGVWMFVRDSLARWAYLDRVGLEHLGDVDDPALDLAAVRERVAVAADLLERLFSGDMDLRIKPTLQAQLTGNLLRLIAEDQLGAALGATVTEQILPLLHASQRRYGAMVAGRLAQPDEVANLRTLRTQLQRAINFYSGTVVGLLSLGGPAAIPVVEAALHPIVALRQARANRSAATEASEGSVSEPGVVESEAQAE